MHTSFLRLKNLENVFDMKLKFKGSELQYFELFWPRTKLPLNDRKPENNSYKIEKHQRDNDKPYRNKDG